MVFGNFVNSLAAETDTAVISLRERNGDAEMQDMKTGSSPWALMVPYFHILHF